MIYRSLTCWSLLLVVFALGCGAEGGGETTGPAQTPVEEGGIKRVSADSLPAVGEPMPPLEGGTLVVYEPKNAKRLLRSTKYVCGFYYNEASSPPRIVITAEENPFPSISKVTEQNVEEFAKLTAEHYAKQDITPLEPPLAMMIGDMPCVRYVLATRFRSSKADRQILDTIRNGKLYRLDLQVITGELLQYRDDSYAVMAHMEFLDSPIPPSALGEPGSEEPAAEAPQEEPAAEQEAGT